MNKHLEASIKTKYILDRALYPADTEAADSISEEPVSYRYTVHNLDLNRDIANVYAGVINGEYALIKVHNGIVLEQYLKSDDVACITYDEDGNPFEYYVKDDVLKTVTKYSYNSNEVTVTHIGQPVLDKPFTLGYIQAWSQKKYGLILEYIRKLDNTTELYQRTYKEALDEIL